MKNTIAERIYDFLKDYPPFNLIEEELLMEISKSIKVNYAEKGDLIFSINDEVHDSFYIVRDGAIGLFRTVNENENLVDVCDEGDIFGLRVLIKGDQYLLDAKAYEESIIYAIPNSIFKEVTKDNIEVNNYILANFSTNIRQPFTKNNNDELFANVDSLDKKSDFSEIKTAEFSKNPITCDKSTIIKVAVTTMSENNIGSMVVTNNGSPIGIFTDKDLRHKVATGITSIDETVDKIMSSPIKTYLPNITVAEAQIAIITNRMNHLCITDDGTSKGELIGILSEHDIVVMQGNNPSALMKEIVRATSNEGLKFIRQKASRLLNSYLEQSIPISFIIKINSEINLVITQKVISIILENTTVKPPVEFAWLSIGSQGREEQILLTDQDNALIFEDVERSEYAETKEYFIELSEKINDGLNIVGFEYCPAEMMARNPKWNLSYAGWNFQFKNWIRNPGEKEIMNSNIFFDFDFVYGSKRLVEELSSEVYSEINSYEIFLAFMAKNALKSPPPLGFFRNFVVENNGEHKDKFDIKLRAIMPLVDAARVLILSYGVKDCNSTIKRFEKLGELEPQNKDLFDFCISSFKVLLRFRAIQGISNEDSGRFINQKLLSKSDRLKLRACFKSIKAVQELLTVRYNLGTFM